MRDRGIARNLLAAAVVCVMTVPYVKPAVCDLRDHGDAMAQCCDEPTHDERDDEAACGDVTGCCVVVVAIAALAYSDVPVLPVSPHFELGLHRHAVTGASSPLTPPPRA